MKRRRRNTYKHLGILCGRKVKIIHAPPVPSDSKMTFQGPIANVVVHLGGIGVHDVEDTIVMEVVLCESKDIIKETRTPAVPRWNVGWRSQDGGHREIVWYIDKEKVDTGMGLGIPVKASPTDTNL